MKSITDGGSPPGGVTLTRRDLAAIAGGTGNLPDETALRLKTLIDCCQDPERWEAARRWAAARLAEMRRLAADAGVELLADGLYALDCLEKLGSAPWESPGEVLDPRLDVPYRELISLAAARAERTGGEEKAEIERLGKRLIRAQGDEVSSEDLVEPLIDRLLEVGDEAAEEALRRLVGRYRERRAAAA